MPQFKPPPEPLKAFSRLSHLRPESQEERELRMKFYNEYKFPRKSDQDLFTRILNWLWCYCIIALFTIMSITFVAVIIAFMVSNKDLVNATFKNFWDWLIVILKVQ
jgi:hypothetical protein